MCECTQSQEQNTNEIYYKIFYNKQPQKKVSTLHSQFSEYVESEKHTQSVEEQQEKCNFYDRIYGRHESK